MFGENMDHTRGAGRDLSSSPPHRLGLCVVTRSSSRVPSLSFDTSLNSNLPTDFDTTPFFPTFITFFLCSKILELFNSEQYLTLWGISYAKT